jgi:hypothetical protein
MYWQEIHVGLWQKRKKIPNTDENVLNEMARAIVKKSVKSVLETNNQFWYGLTRETHINRGRAHFIV